jgi:hypothetical protein
MVLRQLDTVLFVKNIKKMGDRLTCIEMWLSSNFLDRAGSPTAKYIDLCIL